MPPHQQLDAFKFLFPTYFSALTGIEIDREKELAVAAICTTTIFISTETALWNNQCTKSKGSNLINLLLKIFL